MAEPKPPKHGLFGGAPKKEAGPSSAYLVQQVTNVTTRLRVLEDRHTNSRKKMQLVEQNMLANHKKAMEEIKLLKSEIDDVKHTMAELENRIVLLIKELRLSAKKEDLDVLKKYVELWEPIKFVTETQVENIVKDILEEMRRKK